MTDYDYWKCDECCKTFSRTLHPQHSVRVQQRSERIYGTEQMERPVETLVVCGTCRKRYEQEMGR